MKVGFFGHFAGTVLRGPLANWICCFGSGRRMMKNKMKNIVVASLLVAGLLVCTASICKAECLTCNQPVTAYYGATAPAAMPCATGACDPMVATAYRPAYKPLFSASSYRRYERMMRRWNRFWARNEPAPMAQPIAMTAGYGSAYSPCATTCYKPQQCCRYVPQTCYRTEYCNVPVTTYRPVSTCDPCTGCTTTCMKPCTTYQRQARQVPYTSYRMVCETRYTPVVSCQPTVCDPCGSPCGLGNCATGNCATGNCATVSGMVGSATAAPNLPGQSTPQPTLAPSAVETNRPSSEIDIQIKPEVEIQPMRDLDNRYQPSLDGESQADDRMASIDAVPTTVTTVSTHGGWRASSR